MRKLTIEQLEGSVRTLIKEELENSEINSRAAEMHDLNEDFGDYFHIYEDNGTLVASSSGQSGDNVSNQAVCLYEIHYEWPVNRVFNLEVYKL